MYFVRRLAILVSIFGENRIELRLWSVTRRVARRLSVFFFNFFANSHEKVDECDAAYTPTDYRGWRMPWQCNKIICKPVDAVDEVSFAIILFLRQTMLWDICTPKVLLEGGMSHVSHQSEDTVYCRRNADWHSARGAGTTKSGDKCEEKKTRRFMCENCTKYVHLFAVYATVQTAWFTPRWSSSVNWRAPRLRLNKFTIEFMKFHFRAATQ